MWKNILKPIWSYEKDHTAPWIWDWMQRGQDQAWMLIQKLLIATDWKHRKLISMNQFLNNQVLTSLYASPMVPKLTPLGIPCHHSWEPYIDRSNRSNCAKESGNTALLKSLGKLSEAAVGEDLNMAQRILGEMGHCSAWCCLQEMSNSKCEKRTECNVGL